jgi:acyl-CoA thioester hydrolase
VTQKPRELLAATTHENSPRLRVTYHDTDQMGHAYYGRYMMWFEVGRTELLRVLGMCYRDWEETHGVFLPVTHCWCDYKRGARYDDVVRIDTAVTQLSRATISFHYEVHNDATGQLLAVGGTRHAFVGRDGRIVRVADKLLPQLLASASARADQDA